MSAKLPQCQVKSKQNLMDLFSLAEMELRVLIAAFFQRFNASVDPSMTDGEMELYDGFSASPVGGRLLLLLEKDDS